MMGAGEDPTGPKRGSGLWRIQWNEKQSMEGFRGGEAVGGQDRPYVSWEGTAVQA